MLESERTAVWRCAAESGTNEVCPGILVSVPAAVGITSAWLGTKLELAERSAILRPYAAAGVGLSVYDLEWQGGGRYVPSSGSVARKGLGPRIGIGAEWSWQRLTAAVELADQVVWFESGESVHDQPMLTAGLSLRVH